MTSLFSSFKKNKLPDTSSGDIIDVAWNKTGTKIAYTKTGNEIVINNGTFSHIIRSENISAVAWDPRDDAVTVGGRKGVETFQNSVKISEFSVEGAVKLIEYSCKGTKLAFVVKNGTKYSVQVQSSGQVTPATVQFQESVYSLAWSNSEDYFCCGFGDGSIAVFRSVDSDIVEVLRAKASVSAVNCLKWCANGSTIVAAGHEGLITVWDVDSWSCRSTYSAVDAPVVWLSINFNGEFVAAGFGDKLDTKIIELESGTEVYEIPGSRGSEYNLPIIEFRPGSMGFSFTTNEGKLMYMGTKSFGEERKTQGGGYREPSVRSKRSGRLGMGKRRLEA